MESVFPCYGLSASCPGQLCAPKWALHVSPDGHMASLCCFRAVGREAVLRALQLCQAAAWNPQSCLKSESHLTLACVLVLCQDPVQAEGTVWWVSTQVQSSLPGAVEWGAVF